MKKKSIPPLQEQLGKVKLQETRCL